MWVDVIVEDILKTRPADRYVVNDAWSPSGPAHVGSLRGVVLHDSLARGLRDAGRDVRFLYGFDDYDPVDGVPASSPEFSRYLGMPQSEVPSPGGGPESFAQYYGNAFVLVFNRLGITPEVYWTSEMYKTGRFNEAIRLALDRAEEFIQIDREVSGSKKAERHPVQVICDHCGRIGTTVVLGWSGSEVTYECRPDKVSWATGCGHRGRRSPFDGGSKLQYKAEWAAKWWILRVEVEGAGKDHMTRGGSHDVASALAERVFRYRTPYPIPYEYFLVGGRKMASSKGLGMLAADLVDILRPELARFLIIRPHHRQQINFDPGGETIPKLYDDYDRAAESYAGQLTARTPAESELLRDYARTFSFSRIDDGQAGGYRMRFAKVAYLMQMPAVDLWREAEREHGQPLSERERADLQQRMEDARRWLQTYAPDHYRFAVQTELPSVSLTSAQREFLARLAEVVSRQQWTGEGLHEQIHALKAGMGLPPKDAFGAIYGAFLGKNSGPQAGWFLAALDRNFVVGRLREAAGLEARGPMPEAR